jgi:transcription initiation factor TFIID subunit 10
VLRMLFLSMLRSGSLMIAQVIEPTGNSSFHNDKVIICGVEDPGLLPKMADNLGNTSFQEAEENEKKLLDVLALVDSYEPLIPEELIDYYFTKAGVQCEDARLKKLVSLIGQKFLSDVTSDAIKHARLRNSSNALGSSVKPSSLKGKQPSFTLEDLSFALSERGIDIQRPPYHQ